MRRIMPRKKGMATNPDAIAKSFIKYYKIVTQKDLAKLNARLDRIEIQIKAFANGQKFPVKYKVPRSNSKVTSTDIVYDVIKRSKKGLKFSEIQAQTGFKDRTIRNILYRLHQNGIIQRKSRGVYVAG
jgi:predicted transcriptional regulator